MIVQRRSLVNHRVESRTISKARLTDGREECYDDGVLHEHDAAGRQIPREWNGSDLKRLRIYDDDAT